MDRAMVKVYAAMRGQEIEVKLRHEDVAALADGRRVHIELPAVVSPDLPRPYKVVKVSLHREADR